MKTKNYKLRSRVYKVAGEATLAATTLGGFAIYESAINWSNFKQDMENFVMIQENSVKLNLAMAFPMLIAIIVYLAVVLKKNREFFKDKVSIGLLLTIVILYMFYSIIEVAMASLIGAFGGSLLSEFVFTPLSQSAKKKHEYEQVLSSEYDKEKIRITARKLVESEDMDGSV